MNKFLSLLYVLLFNHFSFISSANGSIVHLSDAAGTLTEQSSPLPEDQDSDHIELLRLINDARQQLGLPPMRVSQPLSLAAQAHAEDMGQHNYFDHTGRDGSSPGSRARQAGYHTQYVGENIAGGTSPEQAFELWRNSPGHRRNMLTDRYIEIGIGSSPHSDYGYCWVLVLGNPPR